MRRADKLAAALVPPVEAARARTELARRKQAVHAARERWQVASADLIRVLRLDATALIDPLEAPHLRVSLIGLDETILSKIVNGFREPTPQLRERIAALLHSDVNWLFEPVNAESGLKDTPTPANGQDGAARKKSA